MWFPSWALNWGIHRLFPGGLCYEHTAVEGKNGLFFSPFRGFAVFRRECKKKAQKGYLPALYIHMSRCLLHRYLILRVAASTIPCFVHLGFIHFKYQQYLLQDFIKIARNCDKQSSKHGHTSSYLSRMGTLRSSQHHHKISNDNFLS